VLAHTATTVNTHVDTPTSLELFEHHSLVVKLSDWQAQLYSPTDSGQINPETVLDML